MQHEVDERVAAGMTREDARARRRGGRWGTRTEVPRRNLRDEYGELAGFSGAGFALLRCGCCASLRATRRSRCSLSRWGIGANTTIFSLVNAVMLRTGAMQPGRSGREADRLFVSIRHVRDDA